MKTILQVAALFCLQFAAIAQPAHLKSLQGSVPVVAAGLQPLRHLDGTNQLKLAIGLPLHNREALTNLLQRLYDPASPDYHHYLTPAQFTEKFGPTAQDYEAVIHFAKASGLEIAKTHDSRILLDVRGKAADMEKAFHVKLHTYQHPTEPRQFYAPDVEPSVDASLPIQDITGLSDYARLRPAAHRGKPAGMKSAPASGSQIDGYYLGSDFRHAYASGVTNTGAGQMVGLFEADGYYTSDITNYEALAGLTNVPLTNILVDGFNGSPGSDNFEVALDIEMAIAMAPGLSGVIVFEVPNNTSDWLDALDAMASSNQIKQLSSSWGFPGNGSTDNSFDTVFQTMAAHGQSFFQASGDGDAWVGAIWIPADSPYLTSVGGTSLTMNGSGVSYNSETVWNDGTSMPPGWPVTDNGYWGSGGGVSTVYSIPSWQSNLSMTANMGSTNMRNIPDVALTADDVWVVYSNGQSEYFMGTSCAAPLWAGFMALVNQQAATYGVATAGFINPAIYALGQGATYSSCFHDITTGNNTNNGSDNLYFAVSGYDLCTGWGSPNGAGLITALLGTTPSDDFNYLTNAGAITITGYIGTNDSVIIPGIINSLTVNSIATNAFAGLTNLTIVTIPSSVTSIGAEAFFDCTNLTAINVNSSNPDYVSVAGVLFNHSQTMLNQCPGGLSGSYTIPIGVTSIAANAFGDCPNLTGVEIPASVTSIGANAFLGSSSLASITVDLGNSVYSGVNGVLYNQNTLFVCPAGIGGGYTIPSGVTSIGANAFMDCSNLTSVTIPASVTSIGNDAFENCTGLTSLFFDGNAPTVGSSVFSGDSATIYYISGTTGWSSPFAGLTADDEFAFTTNNGVITITNYYGPGGVVTIPTNITGLPVATIGDGTNAVFPTSLMFSVTIPAGISNIAANAFEYCSYLTSVTIGNTVTNIGVSAFNTCDQLTNVTLGANVASIGEVAFFDCFGLASITIPDSVTNIGEYAFQFSGLTSVTIPASLTSIGEDAFEGASLTNVTISDGVTNIGVSAFDGNGLTSVTIPASVTSIEDEAFADCNRLSSVYFEGNAPSADATVFEGDYYTNRIRTNIVTVYYLPGATGWGTNFAGFQTMLWIQFNYTTNAGAVTLISYTGVGGAVTIPTIVTNLPVDTIGNGASPVFSASLTSITIPAGITSIANYAFQSCSNLTDATMTNSVTNIGDYAFQNCSSLTNITLGINVASIGSNVFQNCSNLANIIIPDSVTNLGDNAFQSCISLTNITLGINVTSIGSYAFQNCSNLAVITLDTNVATIGSNAFQNCSSLTNIAIGSNVNNIGEQAFAGCGSLTAITVAAQNLAYSSVNGVLFDKAQATLIQYPAGLEGSYTIPAGVTSIAAFAFAGASLTNVTMPSSVTSIGELAFEECANLTSVTIGSGVTNIGGLAFYNCTGLTNLTISGSVTNIGSDAFENCTNLTSIYFNGNAPTASGTAFQNDTNATGYYLAGTTGWSNFSATTGLPVVLLNPATPTGSLQVTIIPAGAISNGAQWLVDGGTLQNSGATVFGLSVSNHLVSFNTISGWITPADTNISISANTNTSIVGEYVFIVPTGSLQVVLLPASVITAGAQWQVDGGSNQISGAIVTNLTVSNHVVSFTSIPGLNTPANQTVAIADKETTTTTGVYTFMGIATSGALNVTLVPSVVTEFSDATWQVDGGPSRISGVTVSNLSAGSHVVSFTPIAGWNSPPNQNVTITNGVTAMTSGIYTFSNAPGDMLTLITNGAGTIQHAAWPADLVIGNTYKVTAAPKAKNIFTGWTGGTSQPYSALNTNLVHQFTMEPNLVLEANFQSNIFLTAQGTYKGLFAPANSIRQQTNSGSFSFALTSNRAFSGSFVLGSLTVTFSGKFDLGGAAEIIQSRELPLTMTLQLDFADQSVSGTLETSAFTAAMNGYRAAGNAEGLAGPYTFVIPGASNASAGPFGDSYGTVKVNSLGAVTLAGSLADGTSISQSSVISQDGYWPVYVSLYGGQGSLWGWNFFTSNNTITAVPVLSWINATNSAKTAVYRSGFTNQETLFTGEFYKPGQPLPSGLTATLQESNQPAIVVTTLSELALKFNKTTGAISGSFANPAEPSQKIKFNGVLLQNENEGEGWFLGTNQSGEFLLESP